MTISYMSNCQDFNITYKVFPKNLLEGKTDVPKEGIYLIKEGTRYAKKEEFSLKINENLSYFSKVDKLISRDDKLVDVYKHISKSFTDFNDNVIFNREKNYIIYEKTILYETYTVKQKPFEFDWEIKNSFKKVLGFDAQKAVGHYVDIITGNKHSIKAWFISEISIPSGPDIFLGLPGLIVEVDLPKSTVKITEINEVEDLEIPVNTNNGVLSNIEFKEILDKLNSKINKIGF